ncbi:MAG TPA: ATP-dependent metallopeptidase FtsH/Yme1/Tma family protein, partial [Bacteroidales bacterium]
MSEKDENKESRTSRENRNQKTDNRSDKNIFTGKDNGSGGAPKPKFNIYWIYGLIIIGFLSIQIFNIGSSKVEEITWNKLQEMVQTHDIDKIVVINEKKAEVYLKQDRINSDKYKKYFNRGFSSLSKTGPQFNYNIGDLSNFEKNLDAIQKDFDEKDKIYPQNETRKDIFGDLLSWLLPVILLVAVWMFIFRRMSSGSGGGPG